MPHSDIRNAGTGSMWQSGERDCFSCQLPSDRGQGGLAFSEKVFTPLGVCCSPPDQLSVPGSLFWESLLRPWIHELVPSFSAVFSRTT